MLLFLASVLEQLDVALEHLGKNDHVDDRDRRGPTCARRSLRRSHTFTKEAIGTRYVMLALRTLVDPADPKDVEQAHALQDAVRVSQKSAGTLEIPNGDPVS